MSQNEPVKVNFGSRQKNRISENFQGWMRNLRENFREITEHSAAQFKGLESPCNVGVALGAGPTAWQKIDELYNVDFVVSAADRAATGFNETNMPRCLLVSSTDCSPQVSKFYAKIPTPYACFLPIFTHPDTCRVLAERMLPRFYYTPAFQQDDKEFLLLDKALVDLTGCPLIPGVADSGGMCYRAAVGVGCKRIGLLGIDYGENPSTPFQKWTLYPAYKQWMDYYKLKPDEMMKRMRVRTLKNRGFGNLWITDVQWDSYRRRLLHLVSLAEKQHGVKTYNVSGGGSIDELPCMTLPEFLEEKA